MMRLLIVRLGSLGDLVHALPAVATLGRIWPDARIDWLVDAVHRPFLDLVPIVSQVVSLESPSVGGWLDVRRRLRARTYDAALDLQGLLKSAALARLSGARRVVGFDRASLREPAAALLYTERMPVGDEGHVIQKNLRLVHEFAKRTATSSRAEIEDRDLEFPLASVESRALSALEAAGVGEFALINPGAAWPNKRWPAAAFGAVAKHIHARHGLRPVILWGPEERSIADAVVEASGGVAWPAPETTIADLVALARRARLFVSGDTGPLHIAAAVGLPVVALFGPTTPGRNGPWNPRDRALSRYDACECHYERRCRRAAGWCLAEITVAEVAAAIDERMAVRSERSGAPGSPQASKPGGVQGAPPIRQ